MEIVAKRGWIKRLVLSPRGNSQLYEHKHQRPIPRRAFIRRFVIHLAIAAGVVLVSLLLGIIGYTHYEHLPWRDAFLNAAMLLGGMGPVNAPLTPGGKVFAGVYALYAGLVFLVAIAVAFAPLVHRVLHKFHWDRE